MTVTTIGSRDSMRRGPYPLVRFLIGLCVCITPALLSAQVEQPDRRFLFERDKTRVQEVEEKTQKETLKPIRIGGTDARFSAGRVEFLQESDAIRGTEGVTVSREGMKLRAEELLYSSKTQQVDVPVDMILSFPSGELIASEGKFSLETETGGFEDASLTLNDGGYRIAATHIEKTSEDDFELENSEITTCQCADGSVPWSIGCTSGSVEREGYAYLDNLVFRAANVPLIYLPYAVLPVKTKRSPGLLFPTVGYSNRHGIQYSQPIFVPLDESFDFTLTPFIEARTRVGSKVDVQRIFSQRHVMSGRLIYSNESNRGESLRGTNVTDIFDPTFDTNRFGGFYKHFWQTERDALLPSAVVIDAHAVSDDLFLRELADDDIGDRSSRVLTSRAVFRSSVGSWLYGDLSAEYNQSIREDQDFVLQRLPELDLTATQSFRPFGFNPYGLKVKTNLGVQAVSFQREKGVDGNRYNVRPTLSIPYHYKNYLNADLSLQGDFTSYRLDEDMIFGTDQIIEDDDRSVFQLRHRLSTAVERVYDVDPNSSLVTLTSLGADNQQFALTRFKHTIEPEMNYQFIPFTSQDQLPFFDSFDRIRNRNNISAGVRSRLLGRFAPPFAGGDRIPELTPRVAQLPSLLSADGQSFFNHDVLFSDTQSNYVIQRGTIRELVNVAVLQNFDVIEHRKNLDPNRSPWSDITVNVGLFPTPNLGFSVDSNYDYEDSEFSSYSLAGHVRDDRGDIFRGRYTFIDDILSQAEANAEIVLTDRYRLAGYARYDEQNEEIIEASTALRLQSSCNCWYIDVGYAETLNPDNQRFLVTFSLRGLGDFTQKFGLNNS